MRIVRSIWSKPGRGSEPFADKFSTRAEIARDRPAKFRNFTKRE
jgi:hypothetical protein